MNAWHMIRYHKSQDLNQIEVIVASQDYNIHTRRRGTLTLTLAAGVI